MLSNNQSRWGLFFMLKLRIHQMAPFSWSHVIQIRRSPQDPKLILEDVIYILF